MEMGTRRAGDGRIRQFLLGTVHETGFERDARRAGDAEAPARNLSQQVPFWEEEGTPPISSARVRRYLRINSLRKAEAHSSAKSR